MMINVSTKKLLSIWCHKCDHKYKRCLLAKLGNMWDTAQKEAPSMHVSVRNNVNSRWRSCTQNLPFLKSHLTWSFEDNKCTFLAETLLKKHVIGVCQKSAPVIIKVSCSSYGALLDCIRYIDVQNRSRYSRIRPHSLICILLRQS